MKLLMHILKKNEKLKIDNRDLSIQGIIDKLDEETQEVFIALKDYSEDKTLHNLKEIIRETFDVIQICILILWRCHMRAVTIEEPDLIQKINIEHKDKLISERQWEPVTGIKIDIKE